VRALNRPIVMSLPGTAQKTNFDVFSSSVQSVWLKAIAAGKPKKTQTIPGRAGRTGLALHVLLAQDADERERGRYE
jgi:hypothetical protein